MPPGPQPVTVRALAPDDWRTVRDLRVAALHDAALELGAGPDATRSGTEVYWRGWPARGMPLAGFLADRPVGLVGVVAATADSRTAQLVALWVAPEARGAGVGDALVDAVADVARDWGCRTLHLEVLTTNQPAIRLYRRHGFVLSGEPPIASGAVGMRLALPLRRTAADPGGPVPDA
jgi:ribosomal protein S18 acetylase RimI-like enzyme